MPRVRHSVWLTMGVCFCHTDEYLEQQLWMANTCSPDRMPVGRLGSRRALTDLLKAYRHALVAGKWQDILASRRQAVMNGGSRAVAKVSGADRSSADSALPTALIRDLDELFACIALQHYSAKAVALALNAAQKRVVPPKAVARSGSAANFVSTQQQQLAAAAGAASFSTEMWNTKLARVLTTLAPGTRSDLSNALLEALEHLWHAWMRRFDPSSIHLDREHLLSSFTPLPSSTSASTTKTSASAGGVAQGLVRFLSFGLVSSSATTSTTTEQESLQPAADREATHAGDQHPSGEDQATVTTQTESNTVSDEPAHVHSSSAQPPLALLLFLAHGLAYFDTFDIIDRICSNSFVSY